MEEEPIDETVPLTKTKYNKNTVQAVTDHDVETVKALAQEEVIEKPKSKRKMTKPKTQAQLQAFEKARLTRLANIEKLNKQKELYYAKLLEEHNKQIEPEVKPVAKKAPKKQVIYKEEESDSEPEVVYVKKPSKKKKKKKIIIESSSESSSEEETVSIQRQPAIRRQVTFNSDDFFA